MSDRSSRPHRMPAKTDRATTGRIVSLRLRKRLGPVQLAAATGVAPPTAHRVLTRYRLNRGAHVDRATGEPVRRYEHDHPGAMLHVDVTKFRTIPDGGGWRFVGRAQGGKNRATTPGKPTNAYRNPKMGHAFVHTVIDDHSRVAYAQVHDDETAATATGVLRRAVAWFAARGITTQRVLPDNGSPYVSPRLLEVEGVGVAFDAPSTTPSIRMSCVTPAASSWLRRRPSPRPPARTCATRTRSHPSPRPCGARSTTTDTHRYPARIRRIRAGLVRDTAGMTIRPARADGAWRLAGIPWPLYTCEAP